MSTVVTWRATNGENFELPASSDPMCKRLRGQKAEEETLCTWPAHRLSSKITVSTAWDHRQTCTCGLVTSQSHTEANNRGVGSILGKISKINSKFVYTRNCWETYSLQLLSTAGKKKDSSCSFLHAASEIHRKAFNLISSSIWIFKLSIQTLSSCLQAELPCGAPWLPGSAAAPLPSPEASGNQQSPKEEQLKH